MPQPPFLLQIFTNETVHQLHSLGLFPPLKDVESCISGHATYSRFALNKTTCSRPLVNSVVNFEASHQLTNLIHNRSLNSETPLCCRKLGMLEAGYTIASSTIRIDSSLEPRPIDIVREDAEVYDIKPAGPFKRLCPQEAGFHPSSIIGMTKDDLVTTREIAKWKVRLKISIKTARHEEIGARDSTLPLDRKMDQEVKVSHKIVLKVLDNILHDFGLARRNGSSSVELLGAIPAVEGTKSTHINMSLAGSIPALANAIVATQIFEARGGCLQSITVDLQRAHNYLDPDIGNPFLGGIYETSDGRHVVPSAVYVDLVYKWSTLLNCAVNPGDVAEAIKGWTAHAEISGMPLAVIQSEETWKATPQGRHLASLPIVPVRKATSTPPKVLSLLPKRPLEGLKVLCVTHAIAGPSSGRTLAEYGASVLQIMYTHGYEHPFVYTYANLGSASARLNFNRESDRSHMWQLIKEADVWIDSYREEALKKFGFTDETLHNANPSLIISHVRVYGATGPWAVKPGFDMQGSASSGLMAICGGGLSTPAWPPGQVINDYTTGYYGALAIQTTVLRRMKEGGGYVLSPSLTGTAMSIIKHFKTSDYPELQHHEAGILPPHELKGHTGLGVLKTLQPLPLLSETPLSYPYGLLSVMGSDLPVFPGSATPYDVDKVEFSKKEQIFKSWVASVGKHTAELKELRDAHSPGQPIESG
nr:acetyl-coa:oxalate coa-transferase [Quercus suber]